ncbi:peptidoglycan DD-metalloendopeptidase family protein [Erythrobacter sp. KMU-140]|uniref:Peptidoglycan DD-metalloendopeptidase family protein n=2 Tax=Erythrobacter rubeus TaxID=2760803 RepID=A0ABR8KVL5_9SPHN|nr:peptidoglycan DD-metalloendopeptidase family protein [Erythrobacter rubeus]
MDPDEAQAQLERATRESRRAEARAARLAREAEAASEAAERTAREAAAIAAQIQRAEADIAATRARFSLARTDRAAIAARLAERQQPLARLTGALQTTARRPLALSALQPGSLKELVYVRAVLDSAIPQIRSRTAALRSDLDAVKRLEQSASDALEALRQNEQTLQARREELAELETRQRLALREARSTASREAERALALAEETRDLDGLMGRIDAAASLRRELASLPGPVMRPANIGEGGAVSSAAAPDPVPSASPTTAAAPPRDFQLPVQGRTLAGFGERRDSGLRSTGLALAPVPGAQIVAPATGRVVFAGPYRGYGRIVIIEHAGGWTSLVTGLERTTVGVGDEVIGGSPLGSASRQEPSITLELRREGEPVNPLQFLG